MKCPKCGGETIQYMSAGNLAVGWCICGCVFLVTGDGSMVVVSETMKLEGGK